MISESVDKISRDIMYVSEQPLLLKETLQRVIHCILLERKSIILTSIHSKLIMLKVYCDYFLILSLCVLVVWKLKNHSICIWTWICSTIYWTSSTLLQQIWFQEQTMPTLWFGLRCSKVTETAGCLFKPPTISRIWIHSLVNKLSRQ